MTPRAYLYKNTTCVPKIPLQCAKYKNQNSTDFLYKSFISYKKIFQKYKKSLNFRKIVVFQSKFHYF